MATRAELIAANKSVDEIRDHVGATSLHYLTLDGLQASTGLPRSQFCRACFDGDYPIAVPEEYAMCKMRFEKGAAALCSAGGGGEVRRRLAPSHRRGSTMADDQGFTYKEAGVDVEAGNRAVDLMRQRLKSTKHPLVLGGLGGFGGAMRLPKLKDPVLVAGTDGVGTKIELARTMGKLGTIGIDLVAMSVNDVSACGAVPLFFLDYLVVGKVVPEEVAEIVAGVDEGCQLAQCVLLGGETAEHPGQFPDGDFDMAGFAVGLAERDELWGPHLVADGDVLVGISSSGLHSNGFSLVRHLLKAHAIDVHSKFLSEGGAFCVHAGPKASVGEVLLAPTIIYSPVLHDLGHAGGVPQIVQHGAVDDGGRQQDLADRGLGTGVHEEGAALAEERAVHVDGVLLEQEAHEAEAVGMQAAGADADEDVAVRDEVRSPQLVALREADGEAGHVEIAVRELPGVLGGLAAEQHALRQLTALVHAGDDLGDLSLIHISEPTRRTPISY